MSLQKTLKRVVKLKKREYPSLLRKIHKKHNISKRTLFYVKEYCSDDSVMNVIIKESLNILILASFISAIGGFGLESLKTTFIEILPLIILFPVLNGSIGNFGIVFASKYSTMIHEGRNKTHPFKSKEIKELVVKLVIIGILTAVLASIFSLVFASLRGFEVVPQVTSKIFLITFIDLTFVPLLIFIISAKAGSYVYKKKEDPNNFLIPISTSAADLLNIAALAILVLIFF
ncbi:magnesium transporter [Candidatus Woesearchaeota archaeon]|nr:magnesium transporter [Candidatus Woesearchaeota archaeon]